MSTKLYNVQFINYQEQPLHSLYTSKIPQKGDGVVFQTGTTIDPNPIFYRVQDVVHGYHPDANSRWVESDIVWVTVKQVSSFGLEKQLPTPA